MNGSVVTLSSSVLRCGPSARLVGGMAGVDVFDAALSNSIDGETGGAAAAFFAIVAKGPSGNNRIGLS